MKKYLGILYFVSTLVMLLGYVLSNWWIMVPGAIVSLVSLAIIVAAENKKLEQNIKKAEAFALLFGPAPKKKHG